LCRGLRAKEYFKRINEYRETKDECKLSDDDILVQIIIEELDEIYDGKASKFFVKAKIQNWSAEP